EPRVALSEWNEPLRQRDLELRGKPAPGVLEAGGAAAAAVQPDEERRSVVGAAGVDLDEVNARLLDGDLLVTGEEAEQQRDAFHGFLRKARAAATTASSPACGSKRTSTSGRTPLPSSGDPSGRSSRHEGKKTVTPLPSACGCGFPEAPPVVSPKSRAPAARSMSANASALLTTLGPTRTATRPRKRGHSGLGMSTRSLGDESLPCARRTMRA